MIRKKIDAHAHVVQYIAGFTSRGELRSVGDGMAAYADGQTFRMLPQGWGERATPENLLKVMDENGVEKAVLLQGQFFGFQNLYTAEAIKKYPTRFTGAACYDPFCGQAEDVKRYLFKELGFRAVKFEMSNGSGLMAYRPPVDIDGEVMNGEYRYAAENNLTVAIDIGRPRNCCWQVDALSSAIRKYLQVNFVICHLLAPQKEDTELLKVTLGKFLYPNVYFDLAALPHNQRGEVYPYPTAIKHLQTAKEILGAKKLLFGTDMPGCLSRDTYAHISDYISESRVFTERELDDIFYDNANEVYFHK